MSCLGYQAKDKTQIVRGDNKNTVVDERALVHQIRTYLLGHFFQVFVADNNKEFYRLPALIFVSRNPKPDQ